MKDTTQMNIDMEVSVDEFLSKIPNHLWPEFMEKVKGHFQQRTISLFEAGKFVSLAPGLIERYKKVNKEIKHSIILQYLIYSSESTQGNSHYIAATYDEAKIIMEYLSSR